MEDKEDLIRRVQVLEVGHRVLVDQVSDIAVERDAMRKEMKEAVAEGVTEAIHSFFDAAQAKAAEKTGRWVWSTLTQGLMRWGVIAAIVITVGKAAGWQVAQVVWESFTGKK